MEKKFTCYDLFVNLISLITLVVDIGTDVIVVIEFYENGNTVWGSLSVLFICLPALVMQFFSVKWYMNDKKLTITTFLPHIFLLGPFFRYIEVIKVGLRARQKAGDTTRDTANAFSQQNDICILRLIEAFMESAPQLGLHLYIVLSSLHVDWISVVSIASSLVSLSWALTAYTDALRLAYQKGYTRRWLGLIVHSLWRTSMAAARLTAFTLFASVFKAWIFLIAGTHWLVMTIVLSVQGTEFGDGCLETTMFRVVAGFIHIFSFLNVKDGRTRYRMSAFYSLVLVENSALFALWYVYTESKHLVYPAASVVFGGFVLGVLFLLVYYRFLHPTCSVPLFPDKPEVYQPTIVHRSPARERREIFNTSEIILDYNHTCNAMVDLSHCSPPLPTSPFVHTTNNTPCPRSATDRNLMAIYESSSKLADISDSGTMKRSQSHGSSISGVQSSGKSAKPPEDYSIRYNEGTDGLMFRIRSQKDLREGDCSPYSVTSLATLSSKPASLSPLDVHKLWEESRKRLGDSSPSSDSSTRKVLFEKSYGNVRRISQSSGSSTSSSHFFSEQNTTVREARPPSDELPAYTYSTQPVIIKDNSPNRYHQNISTISIPEGSVLKLASPPKAVPEDRYEKSHHQNHHNIDHSSIYAVSDVVSHFNRQFEQQASSYLPTNTRNTHPTSSVPHPYSDYRTNEIPAEKYSGFVNPVYVSTASPNGSVHDALSPTGFPNHISPPKSSVSPQSSISSPRSTGQQGYINSSVLSGNSCCSPVLPFIDESASESGSISSSTRAPCDPETCYMSAVTLLADDEVAETLKYETKDLPTEVPEPVCDADFQSHHFVGNDSHGQAACPPPYEIACQRNIMLSSKSNDRYQGLSGQHHQDFNSFPDVLGHHNQGYKSPSTATSQPNENFYSTMAISNQPNFERQFNTDSYPSHMNGQFNKGMKNGKTNQGFDPEATMNGQRNQDSSYAINGQSHPLPTSIQPNPGFISNNQDMASFSINGRFNPLHQPVQPNQAFNSSNLPYISQNIQQTPGQLDYLNIEPSPSLKFHPEHQRVKLERQHSKDSDRLNVSDPGGTPLHLQNFEESPWKFGRNIDIYKKGDWNSDDLRKSSRSRSSKAQLKEAFHLRQLDESPHHQHNPEDAAVTIGRTTDAADGQALPVSKHHLSPPLKSNNQATSIARTRSLTRRNSLRRKSQGVEQHLKTTDHNAEAVDHHPKDSGHHFRRSESMEHHLKDTGHHLRRNGQGMEHPLKDTDHYSEADNHHPQKTHRNDETANHHPKDHPGHYTKAASSSGNKFSGIKRHSDYVQYGRTAKQRQANGQARKTVTKTPVKMSGQGFENEGYLGNRVEIHRQNRQPLKSLQNSPGFSPSDSNPDAYKKPMSRFAVTPKKATSLNVIKDDHMGEHRPMKKWAPADLNKLTPDGKCRSTRRRSSQNSSVPRPILSQLSKARSMEHIY